MNYKNGQIIKFIDTDKITDDMIDEYNFKFPLIQKSYIEFRKQYKDAYSNKFGYIYDLRKIIAEVRLYYPATPNNYSRYSLYIEFIHMFTYKILSLCLKDGLFEI